MTSVESDMASSWEKDRMLLNRLSALAIVRGVVERWAGVSLWLADLTCGYEGWFHYKFTRGLDLGRRRQGEFGARGGGSLGFVVGHFVCSCRDADNNSVKESQSDVADNQVCKGLVRERRFGMIQMN
jgi:hypothetical protein